MSKRLRLRNRISNRTRQRLQLTAGVLTITALLTGVWFLYTFIGNVGSARAQKALEEKTPGRKVLDGFAGRSKISINHQLLKSGIQDACPILVSVRHDDLRLTESGGKITDREGNDILITAADGETLVPFTIERFDPSIGKLLAWIYPNSDVMQNENCFYMYYGNEKAAAVKREEPQTSFAAIWNFNGNFKVQGTVPVTGEYKGIKDDEGRFAGAKDFLAIEKGSAVFEAGTKMQFDKNITVSAWIRTRGSENHQTIFCNESTTGGCKLYLDKNQKLVFEVIGSNGKMASNANATGGIVLEKDKWFQVTATYNSIDKTITSYVNGEKDRSISVNAGYGKGSWVIIGADADIKSGFFNGLLDELRVSASSLTAEQIQNTWNIENEPEKLIVLDGEEVFSASPTLASIDKFEAIVNGSHVAVNWTTSYESNLDYFTLERSSDGKTFSKVASKFGNGNSDYSKNYMIQDPAPIYGNAYYRLRFTSFKKESGVSNIVSVQYDAPPSALYINKVEPNPFSENFSVSYGSQSKTDMEVKLTSISGKVVYREMLRPESGIENVYQFKDSKQLLPGIYFFSLSQDDEQKTVKLIKRL
jgi:hypothetical protein